MAVYDVTTTVAPGVERTDWWCGYLLSGSKGALIAAGLAESSWFIDDAARDARGRRRRLKITIVDNREVRTRTPARGPCSVRVEYSEQEKQTSRFREELREAKAKEAHELACLATSHEHFRLAVMDVLKRYLSNGRVILSISNGGYRFAPEVLDEFDSAVSDICQAFAEGRTLFNPEARKQEIAEIKARTAKLDPGLQRFLSTIEMKD
jgi:hypothetical protein